MANAIKSGTAAAVDIKPASGGYEIGSSSDVLIRVFLVIYSESDKDKIISLFPTREKSKIDLGDIFGYAFINNQTIKGDPIQAKPLNPNISKYPIPGEIAKLKLANTYEANNSAGNYIPQYYYTEIIGSWSTVEHNAVPEYNTEYSKNNPFPETGKVRKLIQGPGDISFEGRSGHSIRFGSTLKDFSGTPWTGPDRSPFMIIRNGQKDAPGLEQIYEDINKDGTSLYFLNGQGVGFIPASSNFDSYGYNVVAQVSSNVVEVKTEIVSEPLQSSAATDNSPVKDTIPQTLPVAQPVSSSIDDLAQQDENELPETEGIEFFQEAEDAVKVSSGTSLLSSDFYTFNGQAVINTGGVVPSTNSAVRMTSFKDSPLYKDSQFRAALKKVCDKHLIDEEGMLRVMYAESKLRPSISLYKNPVSGVEPRYLNNQPNSNWKLKATGLIQWTQSAIGPGSCGKSLEQIRGLSAMEQLPLVDCYLTTLERKIRRNDGKRVGKDIIYAAVFFPILVQNGVYVKTDDWIIGSQKSIDYAIEVAKSNQAIGRAAGKKEGVPITTADFKTYINSI
jgi:hypothetical protein